MKPIVLVLLVVALLSPVQAIPGPWFVIPPGLAQFISNVAASQLLGPPVWAHVVGAGGRIRMKKPKRYRFYRVFFFANGFFCRAFVVWNPGAFPFVVKRFGLPPWGNSRCWKIKKGTH